MPRPCSSPQEMLRRLAFLLYIALYVTYLLGCLLALAHLELGQITAAGGAFVALVSVRWFGCRGLDFSRLCASFPCGSALDLIPPEVWQLLAEFHRPATEWMRRTEIRHRLIELEDRRPEITEAFLDELKAVLAR